MHLSRWCHANAAFCEKNCHPSAHIQLGRDGENIAKDYLRRRGYFIQDQNVRVGKDEIDLIALDPVDLTLVFVEVKARAKNEQDFRPEMDLTFEKKMKLKRSARTWIARKEYEGGYRVDVICIAGEKVTDHFKEIFWGSPESDDCG